MKSYIGHSFEFLLVIITLLGAILLLEFFKTYSLRLVIISFLAVFYVVVGVFHHWEEKNLRVNQVFEHVAIGGLMFVILATLYLKHL